jgi:hypothetical protein
MRALTFPHEEAVGAVCDQAGEFVAATRSRDDLQLLGPSRCHGWSLLDVVVHVRLGLEEMVMGTTSHSMEPPDCDAASYWESHSDDRDVDPVPHILWLRRVASAYTRPTRAVEHLPAVTSSTVTAVRSMPDGVVEFQGKRMYSGDFLATWAVELAVHRLDLALDRDSSSGLSWARKTLEAVADANLPRDLDDRTAVLVGLGRIPSTASTQLRGAFPVSL